MEPLDPTAAASTAPESVPASVAAPASAPVTSAVAAAAPASEPVPGLDLGRAHARRLRDIYRSSGWPCQDAMELELLAAGLLTRVRRDSGHETLRLTEAGIAFVVHHREQHRAAFNPHEALVERVALEMARAGRIAWRDLRLRAQVPGEDGEPRWTVAKPDVFSIRNTTVATYVEPVVHEIKVRRADLLGDLKRPAKRAAYQALGECWYVLGPDARGRPIGEPDEIPAECGVLLLRGDRLEVARPANRPAREALPFNVWMALAKATPTLPAEDPPQSQF